LREYRYDAAGLLAAQTVNRNGSPLSSTRYEYGPSGYVETRSDSRDGSERYAYDPLGRVLEHIDPLGLVTRYHHDPAGDRLVTRSFEPERPTDLADRRLARGHEDGAWRREGAYAGSRYRFDRAGDLVLKVDADATLELEWDGDRHLIATRSNGLLTQYAYDPFGRRVFKENGGLRTLFFWDGDLLAAEEAATPAASSREYAYRAASGIPWACIVTESVEKRLYYFDHDPNGAPVRALDEQGRIVWAVRYTAWGGIATVLANDVDFRLRLQGQYEDPETGLSYNRYRYFEPQIGQFISQDLLGTAAGEGIYAFAVNTVGWADPLGLACQRATGHHLVDRIAGEIDAAAAHAARMLDRGLTAGTPWGELYKNLLKHNPNHWMIPLARGNAIQQIADTRLMNNRYLRDAGVVFNQGHLHDVRNAQKNLLRPDYQVPLEGGRLGIVDVTTTGQGPKINQYLDSANPSHTPSTNVFY
jgi:RHS repeat-associated protein